MLFKFLKQSRLITMLSSLIESHWSGVRHYNGPNLFSYSLVGWNRSFLIAALPRVQFALIKLCCCFFTFLNLLLLVVCHLEFFLDYVSFMPLYALSFYAQYVGQKFVIYRSCNCFLYVYCLV